MLRVVPVVDAAWDHVSLVFGDRGDPATCWCQYFKLDAATWRAQDRAALKSSLCEQIDAARTSRSAGPGVLAYLDDEPVGWAAVESRRAYPRILTSRTISESGESDRADGSVWAITCFVVRVGFRRRGVSTALLHGAIDEARRGGARVVEAYPVINSGGKLSSAHLFHGALSTFESAGFAVTGRPGEGRAVVALEL